MPFMNNPFIDFPITWDLELDFSSTTGWTKTGTYMNIAGGVMDWKASNTSTQHSEVYDLLGSTLSNTAWLIQFKITCNAKTGGATNAWVFWALTSIGTGLNTSTQDALAFGIKFAAVTISQFKLEEADAAGIDSLSEEGSSETLDNGETFYLRFMRMTSTTYKLEIYSDATYTTLLETVSGTTASTVQSLRYISVMTYTIAQAETSTLAGTIDDLKFIDGTSTPP